MPTASEKLMVNRFAFYFLFSCFLLTSVFIFMVSGFATYNINIVEVNLMELAALFIFIIVIILSALCPSYYYFFLIFVLLAFPSPVNDVFPGIFLGSETERGAAIFPIITHIDIFLMIGIVLNLYRNKFILLPTKSSFPFLIILFLGLSIILNLFFHNLKENLLLISGTFQLRFLLLVLLLFATEDISKYHKEILAGILVSVAFLFLESVINSKLKGFDRLSSGSLSVNTFGNIMASILVFGISYFRKAGKYKFFVFAGIIICLIVVLLTQNRMSFFSIPAVFILYYLYSGRGTSHKIKVLFLIIVGVLLIPFVIDLSENILPERFSIKKITETTTIADFSSGSFINVEQSKETSTLFTRVLLFNTSIEMIKENPVIGVGAGRWNYLKEKYGFTENVLIDSHNGVLSILSQYGILSVFFIFFIYLYPMWIFVRIDDTAKHPLSYLAFVNFCMFICDFTNAGVFKYQVYAFMLFNVFVLIRIREKVKAEKVQLKT